MALPLPYVTHPCNVCQDATTLWCSRCHAAWYCSPEHLQMDWNAHSGQCHPFVPSVPLSFEASIAQELGPANSYQAILFPHDSETPQLIRIDCLARPQASGPCKWTPVAGPFVGGTREPGNVIVTRGVAGAVLRFPMQIFYRADFLIDGSPPNRCIQKLTGGHAVHQWNGNVVALKFFGNRRQGYADATNADLAALVAYFMQPPS
ncbi:hypothetical protein DL93DRAFT_2124797 [Clavulina sp. PMI_390]|nr:hypothetical protein DL93DRAFT_2124797 [Clavulina sp. PMI_390]